MFFQATYVNTEFEMGFTDCRFECRVQHGRESSQIQFSSTLLFWCVAIFRNLCPKRLEPIRWKRFKILLGWTRKTWKRFLLNSLKTRFKPSPWKHNYRHPTGKSCNDKKMGSVIRHSLKWFVKMLMHVWRQLCLFIDRSV